MGFTGLNLLSEVPVQTRFPLCQLLEVPHPWLIAPSFVLRASSAASSISDSDPPVCYKDPVKTLGPLGESKVTPSQDP